jgi:hypothetical protein
MLMYASPQEEIAAVRSCLTIDHRTLAPGKWVRVKGDDEPTAIPCALKRGGWYRIHSLGLWWVNVKEPLGKRELERLGVQEKDGMLDCPEQSVDAAMEHILGLDWIAEVRDTPPAEEN